MANDRRLSLQLIMDIDRTFEHRSTRYRFQLGRRIRVSSSGRLRTKSLVSVGTWTSANILEPPQMPGKCRMIEGT